MNIRLQKLTIKNFKGIRGFSFEPCGLDAQISGPNGAGKTSIADSLMWLLFGKNQAGDSAFSVKPVDENGQEIHNLEHSVEAVLKIDSSTVTLRKVMTEKWTHERGKKSAPARLTSHETIYYIDGADKKEGEFKTYVAGLVREDLFRLLTSITHFNAMKWQDRRKILLEVSGDITDESVIKANGEKFAELPEIMGTRTFDDTLKMLKNQRPKINDELDKIPTAIKTALSLKPSDAACIPPQGSKSYSELTAELIKLQNRRSSILSGDASEIQGKINAIRAEIDRKSTAHRGHVLDAEEQRRAIRRQTEGKTILLSQIGAEIDVLTREEMRLVDERSKLLAEHPSLKAAAETKVVECPTCSTKLPDDNSAAAEFGKKIMASAKAALDRNMRRGLEIKTRRAEISTRIDELKTEKDAVHDEIAKIMEQADAVKNPEPPDIAALNTELEELQAKLVNQATPETNRIDADIQEVRLAIKQHDEAAAASKQAGDIDAKVTQLKADQKRLGQEIDEIDRKIMLCESFIKAKVSMLESSVSAKFSPLSFKLFDQQINGGLSETCETLVPSPEGAMVPWGSVNTGHRIMAGLKIIEVLGNHYDLSAPLFIDNAESLTGGLPSMDSQLIRMVAAKVPKSGDDCSVPLCGGHYTDNGDHMRCDICGHSVPKGLDVTPQMSETF